MASSAPATSSKVFCGTSLSCSFARDFPNEKTRFPPCALLIMRKNKKPIIRIGPKVKNSDVRKDCVGTLTLQPLVGGLAVSTSTKLGSWRAMYEASTFVAPLMVFPPERIRRIFCDLSTRTADSTCDFEIASIACEVLISV